MNLYEYHTNPETLYGYKDRFKIPLFAYKEAKRTGNWLEAEPYIMKDPEYAYFYAMDAIQDEWPEAEPYIMKDPEYAYFYARDIRKKGRWPEAEPYIMKDPKYAYLYANEVIKDEWTEAEPYIMKDPYSAYWYARYVIEGRFPEAEPYIMKSPEYAYMYARDIRKKGRWSEAEPAIATSHVVIRYANDVINDDVTHGFKKRWKEAEPYILRDAQKSALYAIMLNTPWEEAEPIIRTSNYWWGRYESMVEDSNHTSIDELEVA